MLASFEAARPALIGLAYRMLGTRADAEDVVQDVFLKWCGADRATIRNPGAWLMTACTRRAIDILRSAERSRTDYVGPWLPEPVAQGWIDEPHELSATLETAFLIVLERASPKERAAFLLHEIFDRPYSEVSVALGVSEQASRKLASRARARIASGKIRRSIAPDRQRQLMEAFEDAILTGDMTVFSGALMEDVRLIADGGGKATAISAPLDGRHGVVAFLENARIWWRSYRWDIEQLATTVAVALHDGENVVARIWFESADGGRISTIYIMRNPDKLP